MAKQKESSDAFYRYADSIENPKKLTIADIRRNEPYRDISDEKALEIIDGLYKLSIICYKIYLEKKEEMEKSKDNL